METCNRDTLKTEGNVKTKVETGVMQLQAKEHQGLPAATGSQERGMDQILPQGLQKEPTLETPRFWT